MIVIEDHTHCSDCGKVCYYPENLKVMEDKEMKLCWTMEAKEMKLCWTCYSIQRGLTMNKINNTVRT